MTQHIDWERLARYVAGESTPPEVAEVERWMASDASHRVLVTRARRQWSAAAGEGDWNVDAAWQRLRPGLGSAVVSLDERRARWNARRLLPLAAAFVGVIGVGALWMRLGSDSTTTASVAASEFHTGVGERRVLNLPDESVATLGVASTLHLTEGFGTSARDVTLEGEAMFVVRHDARRPFRVRAGGAVTEDLGTTFSVRAYLNEGEVRVAVTEGSVSVRRAAGAAGDSVVLSPRDVAVVPALGDMQVMREQQVERMQTWTAGELVFDDTPLSDVARALERWYDVEIRFADPRAATLKYTATLSVELPIDEVLRIIGPAVDARIERTGRVITVRSGGRALAEPVPPIQRNAEREGGGEDGV